jgi:hypothetical protein
MKRAEQMARKELQYLSSHLPADKASKRSMSQMGGFRNDVKSSKSGVTTDAPKLAFGKRKRKDLAG